ncbi:MAG: PCP reductase family protein [Bryobacteraceae bacterium]|nr:PCP reductase family protein [Bryobacteraceae bacterium]MDW8376722.1 PCP reductase family protein [Bryobacterales bacterium]
MDWNEAAEELLEAILSRTPRPVREQTGDVLRETAEALAQEEGRSRVGTESVIAAWVKSTPAPLRSDLSRQLEQLGFSPEDYRWLFEEDGTS